MSRVFGLVHCGVEPRHGLLEGQQLVVLALQLRKGGGGLDCQALGGALRLGNARTCNADAVGEAVHLGFTLGDLDGPYSTGYRIHCCVEEVLEVVHHTGDSLVTLVLVKLGREN